jgi:hypothetical protein
MTPKGYMSCDESAVLRIPGTHTCSTELKGLVICIFDKLRGW